MEQVQTFWLAREVQGAVDFTEQALDATDALSRASGTEDVDQADQAFSDLKATCRSCHREFRERTEDGDTASSRAAEGRLPARRLMSDWPAERETKFRQAAFVYLHVAILYEAAAYVMCEPASCRHAWGRRGYGSSPGRWLRRWSS